MNHEVTFTVYGTRYRELCDRATETLRVFFDADREWFSHDYRLDISPRTRLLPGGEISLWEATVYATIATGGA